MDGMGTASQRGGSRRGWCVLGPTYAGNSSWRPTLLRVHSPAKALAITTIRLEQHPQRGQQGGLKRPKGRPRREAKDEAKGQGPTKPASPPARRTTHEPGRPPTPWPPLRQQRGTSGDACATCVGPTVSAGDRRQGKKGTTAQTWPHQVGFSPGAGGGIDGTRCSLGGGPIISGGRGWKPRAPPRAGSGHHLDLRLEPWMETLMKGSSPQTQAGANKKVITHRHLGASGPGAKSRPHDAAATPRNSSQAATPELPKS